MRLVTAEQIRRIDSAAIASGVPSLSLMEQAARALAIEAEEMAEDGQRLSLPAATGEALVGEESAAFEQRDGKRAAVFCGTGNNGGDGLGCARLLRESGWEVRAFLVGERERMTSDCKEMEKRLVEAGGSLEDFDPMDVSLTAWSHSCRVVVDALLGVGLKRPVEGGFLAAVALMNRAGVPVLSADVPSGVEADTGRVLGAAVRAERTVTFTLSKIGLHVGKGALHAGKVVVAPIGVPDEALAGESFPVKLTAPVRLPKRARDAYKGKFGKVYILGGTVGYTGAPVLASQGALRAGAGLVYLGVPGKIYPIVAAHCVEAMPSPLMPDTKNILQSAGECDVVLLGPGMGQETRMKRLTLTLLAGLKCPVVLDADGINAVAGHIDVLDSREALTVLTPHDGEFARLGGDLTSGDRLGAARGFAQAHHCVLVLKGHRTITALPDGRAYVNGTGNPGMATGGSGDVLGGMIAALLGQKLPSEEAVPLAVYLHGRAGDMAAAELGEYGMLPSDLIQRIPYAMKELE